MLAVDTMKLARNLRDKAKFPQEQAEQTASVLVETFAEWQSNSDFSTRANLREEINGLRSEMRIGFAETKSEILKWIFASSALQIFAIAGTLLGILHSVGKL
jgi:hypothetical protein